MNKLSGVSKSIEDQIMSGLHAGVNRHWQFTKELLRIKPEYLLTFSVADELLKGFGNNSGMDLAIILEARTRDVIFNLTIDKVGQQRWIKNPKPKTKHLSDKSRVDILVSEELSPHNRYAIEIKGFDPSAYRLKLDLLRLQELLDINNGDNNMLSGHLAFPTHHNNLKWIDKHSEAAIDSSKWSHTTTTIRHDTGEDPEDGIPCFFTNCISVYRK